MKDNKFILKGYRINFDTFKAIFKSMGQVHNETVNIYTHLVGFVIFIVIFLCFTIGLSSQYKRATAMEN